MLSGSGNLSGSETVCCGNGTGIGGCHISLARPKKGSSPPAFARLHAEPQVLAEFRLRRLELLLEIRVLHQGLRDERTRRMAGAEVAAVVDADDQTAQGVVVRALHQFFLLLRQHL